MTQSIFGLAIGGSGIVAVLVIVGIFLKVLDVEARAGTFAIWAGVIIGVILGILGIAGVLMRLFR